MTPRQMYSELASVAGFTCDSGESFLHTNHVTLAELKRAQNGLLSILQKLNYRRSHEFGIEVDRMMADAVSMHALYGGTPESISAVSSLEGFFGRPSTSVPSTESVVVD